MGKDWAQVFSLQGAKIFYTASCSGGARHKKTARLGAALDDGAVFRRRLPTHGPDRASAGFALPIAMTAEGACPPVSAVSAHAPKRARSPSPTPMPNSNLIVSP